MQVQDAFIGTISVSAIEAGIGTVGYWLAANQQKKGYMIDALIQLKAIATQSLKLTGLRLEVLNSNTPSAKVAQRCGFRLVDSVDDGTILHGKTVTRHIYLLPLNTFFLERRYPCQGR